MTTRLSWRAVVVVGTAVLVGCAPGSSSTSSNRTGPAVTPVSDEADSVLTSGSTAIDDPPPSLDTVKEMLAPWKGDLDGMVKRRYVRVLVTLQSNQLLPRQG